MSKPADLASLTGDRQPNFFPDPSAIARYDRATERTEHFKLREIVGGIARIGDRVLLATESGVAILDGNKVKRYQVDETTDGRLRVVELTLGKE